jgi:hypothetical protein
VRSIVGAAAVTALNIDALKASSAKKPSLAQD